MSEEKNRNDIEITDDTEITDNTEVTDDITFGDDMYIYETGISEKQELAGFNPFENDFNGISILARGNNISRDGIILSTTEEIITIYKKLRGTYNILDIYNECIIMSYKWLTVANEKINFANIGKNEYEKLGYFKILPAIVSAYLLMLTGDFCAGTDVYGNKTGLLMRQRAGNDIGTWTLQKESGMLDKIIKSLHVNANISYRNEVKKNLLILLDASENKPDNTIIMLEDGVYDCKTGEFLSYLDTMYDSKYGHIVSQTKLYDVCWTDKTSAELEQDCTIYNPNDGTTWSPIQGLIDLVGDGEALQALREIMHFAIRRTSGGFAWWFLNTSGNAAGGGGKSTVLQIIKNLVGGERNALTTSYDHLGDRFALDGLEKKYVIVSDETEGANKKPSDTSVYKALASNGTINIDVKNEKIYNIKWQGVMIQAINGIPLFSDNSDSTYRRFMALPWERKMTQNGRKRDYIRDEYINRPEVIQCYMKWALELGCLTTYSDEVIDYCLPYVEMMKNEAKTVFGFMPEIMRRINDENYFAGMNEVGRSFLYAIFRKWDEEENCSRNHISQKKFWLSVCEWVQSHPSCGWEVTDGITHIYPHTPYQQELVDYDLGSSWCAYNAYRMPSGCFPFKKTKTIRCGLLRVNKLPRNHAGASMPDSSDA